MYNHGNIYDSKAHRHATIELLTVISDHISYTALV